MTVMLGSKMCVINNHSRKKEAKTRKNREVLKIAFADLFSLFPILWRFVDKNKNVCRGRACEESKRLADRTWKFTYSRL